MLRINEEFLRSDKGIAALFVLGLLIGFSLVGFSQCPMTIKCGCNQTIPIGVNFIVLNNTTVMQ